MILYFKKRIRDGGGWSDWKAFRGGHFSSLSSSSLDRSPAAALYPHLRPFYLPRCCRNKDSGAGGGYCRSWGLLWVLAGCASVGGGEEPSQSLQGRGCASDLPVQWDSLSGLIRGRGTHPRTEGKAEAEGPRWVPT